MRIAIETSATNQPHPEEGQIYIDEDGDVNIIIAAAQIEGVRKEDLVVCCLKGDAAWIRGGANANAVVGMTRLTTGDRVTITVE